MKRLLLLASLLTPVLASAESLKEVFAHDFLIGAALNHDQCEGRDEKAAAIDALKEAFIPSLIKVRDGLGEQHAALGGGIQRFLYPSEVFLGFL